MVGILDSVKAALGGGKAGSRIDSDGRAVYFYVRCNACGEKIRVRVDTFNDLLQEFDDRERVSGYTVTKDVMGNACFKMMHLHAEFDGGKRLIASSVENGTLITKADFQTS
jgi:hypothetical protein